MNQFEKFPFSSMIGTVEYQVGIQPDKTAVLYPDPNTNFTEYQSLTYKQLNNILNHLAEKISTYLPSNNQSITCALLANSNIQYLLIEYALLKLPNVIMFPISGRNSSAAIEHLLRETKTKIIFTTSQHSSTINSIQQQQQEFRHIKMIQLDNEEFQIEELFKYKNIEFSQKIFEQNPLKNLINSGSTSFPKPIHITNRYFLLNATLYSSVNPNFWSNDDIVLTWAPLFHFMAFYISVSSFVAGATYALPLAANFPPKTDELIRNIQIKHKITVLNTVPSLLEQLVRHLTTGNEANLAFKPLQKLKYVLYAGAGCPDDLCKTLVENQVTLITAYAATETGVISIKNFDSYDKNWRTMQIPSARKSYLRIENASNTDNPNEKIISHLPTDPYLAENIPKDSFTIGDILLEDSSNAQHYSILDRQDDTRVHRNGEKTNPIPMEDKIRRSSLVEQVAIVGHNQFCTATLIQLNQDEASEYDLKQIEETIWNAIAQANKEAPSHSRILRQLVHILLNEEILPVTDKGNVMRRKIDQQYSELIHRIYDQFFNQEQTKERNHDIQWTKETIKNYLIEKVHLDSDSTKSIFDYGINSLEVLEIRSLIIQNICFIPKNFLYQYSTIDQMTEQVWNTLNSNIENIDPLNYQLTEDIVDKYIQLIEQTSI